MKQDVYSIRVVMYLTTVHVCVHTIPSDTHKSYV